MRFKCVHHNLILLPPLLLFFGILYSLRILRFLPASQTYMYHKSPVPYGVVLEDCRPSDRSLVALTFDDGPSAHTEELLYHLKRYNATATFFVNGPTLVPIIHAERLRKIHAAGHQLGSHTFGHLDISKMSKSQIVGDMNYVEDMFQDALGFKPRYMRPPYGYCNGICQETIGNLGYHIVNWNLDVKDWAEPNSGSVAALKSMQSIREMEPLLQGGAIILLHETIKSTVEFLVPYILEHFSSMSYEFVSVAECLGGDSVNWYKQ